MGSRKEFNRNFFKVWTSEMAYVLGFLFADGNITTSARGNNYVAWYTADRTLLSAIRTALRSEHKLAARRSKTGTVYRIQIGSRELVADLAMHGLLPRKATRMQLPEIPKHFFSDFVRGYFDGDGNVWAGLAHKNRKTRHHVLQATFTSASHEFLNSLRTRLHDAGLCGGSLRYLKGKSCSRLTFSTGDALKLASIMYNGRCHLYLKRKKRVFDKYESITAAVA